MRSGMTISEVLHNVHERVLVTGRPQTAEEDEKPAKGIAISGPHDGRYDLLWGSTRDASEAEVVTLLRQNVVPGRDYKIGFTFTPMMGPHWSMTVVLNPDGTVKEVRPFRIWD